VFRNKMLLSGLTTKSWGELNMCVPWVCTKYVDWEAASFVNINAIIINLNFITFRFKV